MTDVALRMLQQPLNANGDKKAVWVIDENVGAGHLAAVHPVADLRVITNRYDVHLAAQRQGFDVLLTDYDFSALEKKSLDVIYYRVSKEKAVVHHVINAAAEYLKPNGVLYLSGYKNEGIKTYVTKAAGYLGELVDKIRGSNSAMLATLACCGGNTGPLDDRHYRQSVSIAIGTIKVASKPGIYGWNKIDKGSAFLLEQLPAFIATLAVKPERIADLGCGYGYLSILANQQLAAEYIATDNNCAAVALCQQNFVAQQIKGRVVLDDCGAGINDNVDLVLCNPPFHQGFDVEGELTSKFITAARRLLQQEGHALFVVNSFIALEKKAAATFSSVTLLANNGSFKVLLLKAGA